MFKPRLRISRTSGLLKHTQSSVHNTWSPSPFTVNSVAVAKHHQQRSMHAASATDELKVPEQPEAFQDGIKNFLSADGYRLAWTDNQKRLIENLNKKIAGKEFVGLSVKDILIRTSREPALADIFNYASMAYNNEFFFTGIAPKGGDDPAEHMPGVLQQHLELSFGSLETLQKEMIFTANAMFGPGFVWLVRQTEQNIYQRNTGEYRILVTYLAGSPFPGAHWRRQNIDMNSVGGLTDRSGETVHNYFDNQNRHNKRTPLHGRGTGTKFQEEQRMKSPGGADLMPVLCVSTWEHAWMVDYGFDRKLDYLVNWWNSIHWGRVWERSHNGPIVERKMSSEINLSALKKETAS